MNWISLELILLCENLLVSIINILCILLKQIVNSNVKIFMSLHSICIMEYILGEMTMLDIHVLEPVFILLTEKLIEQDLLQVHSFNVQKSNHTVEVSFETEVMICISAEIVYIDLLFDNHLWVSHFGDEVKRNIFES